MRNIISFFVLIFLVGCISNDQNEENSLSNKASSADSNESYSFEIDTVAMKLEYDHVDPGFKQRYNVKIFKGERLVDSLSIATGQVHFFVRNNTVLYETFYEFHATGFEGYYEIRNLNKGAILASNESDQLFYLNDSQGNSKWLSLFHYTESNIITKQRKPDDVYDRVGGTVILATQDSIIDIVDIYYSDREFSQPKILIDSNNISKTINEDLFFKSIQLNTSFRSANFYIGTKQSKIDTFSISDKKIEIGRASVNNEYRFVSR